MKKLYSLLRRVRIQPRLFVILLLTSVLPVSLFGALAISNYSRSLTDRVGAATVQTVQSTHRLLETELEKCSTFIDTISVMDPILSTLTGGGSSMDYSVFSDNHPAIRSLFSLSQYITNIQILDRERTMLYSYGYDDVSAATLENLVNGIDAQSNDSLQYARTWRGRETLVVGRRLHDLKTFETIGYMLVYLDQSLFANQIFPTEELLGAELMYINSAHTIVAAQDTGLLGDAVEPVLAGALADALAGNNESFSARLGEEENEVLVVYSEGSRYGGILVAVLPYAELYAGVYMVRNGLLLSIVLFAGISLALAMVIYKSIMGPMREIISYCNGVQQEGVQTSMPEEGRDEITFLTKTINTMLREIEKLMAQWKIAQERRRQKELESLQYQINPHFLFNTLETYRHIATMNDVPALSGGIASLSDLLRSTLYTTDEFIPISTEIENLSSYFEVQRLRYTDCFTVQYSIEPTLQGFPIPRFILQPLAENAIIHGTQSREKVVLIQIKAYTQGENVVIEMVDNGAGYDIEKAEAAGRTSGHLSGIGIGNVRERLLLYYGEAYGLEISSMPGQGTRCRIDIPKKGGESNVSSADS